LHKEREKKEKILQTFEFLKDFYKENEFTVMYKERKFSKAL